MHFTDMQITEVQRHYLADAEQRRLLAAARKAGRRRGKHASTPGFQRIAYAFRLRTKSGPAQRLAS